MEILQFFFLDFNVIKFFFYSFFFASCSKSANENEKFQIHIESRRKKAKNKRETKERMKKTNLNASPETREFVLALARAKKFDIKNKLPGSLILEFILWLVKMLCVCVAVVKNHELHDFSRLHLINSKQKKKEEEKNHRRGERFPKPFLTRTHTHIQSKCRRFQAMKRKVYLKQQYENEMVLAPFISFYVQ